MPKQEIEIIIEKDGTVKIEAIKRLFFLGGIKNDPRQQYDC
jgi:hypothetical protein